MIEYADRHTLERYITRRRWPHALEGGALIPGLFGMPPFGSLAGSTGGNSLVPLQVGGLRLWQDATAIGGLASDDPVTTWPGKGGMPNATQSDANKKPLYKTGIHATLPVVDFDGTDDNMNVNAAAAAFSGDDIPSTFYAVFKIDSLAAITVGVELHDTGTALHRPIEALNTAVYRVLRRDDANTLVSTTGGTADDTNFHIIATVFNGTNVSVWVDDTLIINNQALDVTAATFTLLRIGGAFNEANGWNGSFGEILGYTGAHTTSQRNLLTGYLNAKWVVF